MIHIYSSEKLNFFYNYKYHNVMWSDDFHIRLSEFLGVKSFKKNWKVKGSFLHRKLNKNSKEDLNNVIDDANEFTEQHQKKYIITFIPLQIVSFGLYYLCKKCKEPELGVLIGLFLNFEAIGITSYALMVHKYNRILARRRIYSY